MCIRDRRYSGSTHNTTQPWRGAEQPSSAAQESRMGEPMFSWKRLSPESKEPCVYQWIRHHPSKADTTTRFDPKWTGNKLQEYWRDSNRRAAAKSSLELMPSSRHMRRPLRTPKKGFFFAAANDYNRTEVTLSEPEKGCLRDLKGARAKFR
eukprot:TRINITY_DN7127_c0_g2_i1.p1 TRINITY_DN7127_c0_g2~~TRINITY_DN7127_c0_g2_i1.p1  ORF type:complete len:151 (-),score=22.90 TRINITY_DN7127_c0_g2_i1:226-678(-)